jgi:hypothetical protein
MEANNHKSNVGTTDTPITRLPRPATTSAAADVATRTNGTVEQVGDDTEYDDDVIRIRLVFDGDELRQIMMVDPEQNEIEWVRSEGAPAAMRNSA